MLQKYEHFPDEIVKFLLRFSKGTITLLFDCSSFVVRLFSALKAENKRTTNVYQLNIR